MAVGLRILIVDDHRVIRERLELRIREQFPDAHTGKAPDLRDTFAQATHRWDVVLLDINLPDGNALEALPRLRPLLPGTTIILMTAFVEPGHMTAALELGAATVLDKAQLFDRLGELIAAETKRELAP